MTPAQAQLLARLIAEDRRYRTMVRDGELTHRDDRGVEVSMFNGVNPRTAQKLAELGLIEILMIRKGQNFAFLGRYEPYDGGNV